jgi:hypothetical protein
MNRMVEPQHLFASPLLPACAVFLIDTSFHYLV